MKAWNQPRRRPSRASQKGAPTVVGVLTTVALAGAAGAGFTMDGMSFDGFRAFGAGCNIKGNVSIETGERIYHVPGQKYYHDTRIVSEYGERWFCSESEARRAGWRKSRI